MHILDELAARGLIADITDREGLKKLLSDGRVTFYVGYDPTSPSLHVGNLVPIMMQARLQRAVAARLSELGVDDPQIVVERRDALARSPGGKLPIVVAERV